MTQPLISVIVPIYNVEPYLKGCLDSLLNQTEQNFEVILVDDGSTDRSGQIADEYAQKDDRFQVIHQENKGAAAARNTGLYQATGVYVAFLDSDDYLHQDFLKIMASTAQRERADLVACKLEKTNIPYHQQTTDADLSPIKLKRFYRPLDAFLKYKEITTSVCLKLHKREAIKDIFFKEGIYFEDALFTTIEMTKVKNIIYIDAPLYYYYESPQSIIRSNFTAEKIESYVIVIFTIYQYFRENYPDYLPLVQKQIINKRVKMCMNQAIRKQHSIYQSQLLFVKMSEEFSVLYRAGIISFDGLKMHHKMALALLIHDNPKGAWVIMRYL